MNNNPEIPFEEEKDRTQEFENTSIEKFKEDVLRILKEGESPIERNFWKSLDYIIVDYLNHIMYSEDDYIKSLLTKKSLKEKEKWLKVMKEVIFRDIISYLNEWIKKLEDESE